MSGENLENFINVKNILIDMGTYFQVQVIVIFEETPNFSEGTEVYPTLYFPSYFLFLAIEYYHMRYNHERKMKSYYHCTNS